MLGGELLSVPHDNAGVEPAAKHVLHRVSGEAVVLSCPETARVQFLGDLAVRLSVETLLGCLADGLCLSLIDLWYPGRFRHEVAEGHRPDGQPQACAMPLRFAHVGSQLVREELGDTAHHREQKLAVTRREVDVLADTREAYPCLPESLESLPLNAHVPRPPVDHVDDGKVEFSSLRVSEKAYQLRTALDALASRGEAVFRVHPDERVAVALAPSLDLRVLRIQRVPFDLRRV
ncbi:MAG: hypothetical protein WD359_01435 [Dehalococcoidia bacterium]